MPRLILLLGGARSGKSSHAQKLAEASGKAVAYIATAQPLDDEMAARIDAHKAERPASWKTLEIPFGLATQLDSLKSEVVILDCVTLLVSNLLMQYESNELIDEAQSRRAVEAEIDSLLTRVRTGTQDWIVISNEVGLGLVPAYQMGRVYRDLLGWANQRLAAEADEVYLMVAGLPMKVK